MGVQKVWRITGLDCANCAAKVERAINALPEVEQGTVDFMAQKLIIEAKDALTLQQATLKALTIIAKLEPDAVLSEKNGASQAMPEMSHEAHGHEGSCGCGHDHGHEAHGHEGSCGCGHEHEAHEHDAVAVPAEVQREVKSWQLTAAHKRQMVKIAAALAIFLVAVLAPLDEMMRLGLFVLSYVIVGGEIVWRAVKNISRGQVFDENFLMTIASIGAFLIGEYPEAVAVILFYQVGELFQSYAVSRSRNSIAALMDIRPEYANLQRSGDVVRVAPESVAVGDVIVVKVGERVPLDGLILAGTSALDTVALTGESAPREVGSGSEILSGCVNLTGLLTVQVSKAYKDSTVAKILDLVENASSKKAEAENFITKFARYYTPIVVGIAALLAIVPPLVLSGAAWTDWVYRALIFLVISCPCALVISVPLSFFAGLGAASKCGILVKGSNYLEALAKMEIAVFDKTGTLTQGVFKVTAIHPVGMSTDELLRYAAYAERTSNHPISQSLLAAYGQEIDWSRIAEAAEISGHGMKALVDGQAVLAGNAKLMQQAGVAYEAGELVGTVVHVAVNGQYAGYILITDEVKIDAKQAIEDLKASGVKQTVMLTGDAKNVGEQMAAALGMDQVYTELLPADKVAQVERLLTQKSPQGKLVFVGDGINDAPVLARADIGIAMGGLGSDAAIEAADVVIMTDEPSKIATAIKISQRTLRIVKQNSVFALGVKFAVLLLGAFGVATMWEAVFADVGVAVIAILNAIRVLKVDHLK